MPNFYRLSNWYGATLHADARTGLLVSAGELIPVDGYRPLLASIPETAADVCFLSAPGVPAIPVSLAARDYRSLVAPVRLMRLRAERSTALLHPATLRSLCAMPVGGSEEVAPVSADRRWVREWETFELVPLEDALIPPDAQTWASSLEQLLARGANAEAVIDFVLSAAAPNVGIVLDAILPLLALRDLEHLGKSLVVRPELLTRLAAVLSADVWARVALPALAGWLALRRSEQATQSPGQPVASSCRLRTFRAGPELDFLADAGFFGRFASFGHACNAYSRASVEPRKDVCVLATARNEGIYFLEWIAWHRALGIEDFFCYCNDNTDGSEELLCALAEAGVITWIVNEVGIGGTPQPKAYAHALSVLPNVLDYRWVLVIDLDELLVPNPVMFRTVVDFLRWQESREVDAIALNWVFVGSGGESVWRDAPVLRRFKHLFPQPDRHVKSFFRPRRFIHSWPHFPIIDERRSFVFRNATGDLHSYRNPPTSSDHAPAFSDDPDSHYACIYHYFYKSAEEFLWKFSRNRGDSPNDPGISQYALEKHFVEWFMRQHTSVEFTLDERTGAWRAEFDAEMERLLSLPKVAEANLKIQRNFRAAVGEVKQALRSSPAIRQCGELGVRFLEIAGLAAD